MKIVFATGNEDKLNEIRQITSDMDIEIISMKEAGVYTDVDETGTTFEENAFLKASAIAAKCSLPTLADDSGLEIDYLGKEPGIYSSRYLGKDTPYSEKNAEILRRLEGVPDEERTARFVCAVCLVRPDGSTRTVKATMEGRIAHEIAGVNGFGYDPIFYLPDRGCTSAELPPEEKNAISHRGKALRMMRDILYEDSGRQ